MSEENAPDQSTFNPNRPGSWSGCLGHISVRMNNDGFYELYGLGLCPLSNE